MDKTTIRKKILQAIFILLFINSFSHLKSAEQPRIDVGQFLKLESHKYILTAPKKARSIFQSSIDKINNECCDEGFPKKNRVEEIKNILEDCLNTNCEKRVLPIFDPKKPPKKILTFRSIQELDNLILENEKFKYTKLTQKFNENRTEKLKNEKNTNILKDNISELENENKKLKNTVDKMLQSYQKKITKLEKQNEELEKKFNEAYEMLPPMKKKKFNKK